MRLFACFESCKLVACITEDTHFEIIGMNTVSKWEQIGVEWLSKVRKILVNSADSPKSLTKFLAVADLWRRATAGYLEFRLRGISGNLFAELPDWLNEESAEEIRRTERRAAASRQNSNSGPRGELWFCDADEPREVWLLDSFTLGRGGAGEDGSEDPARGMVRQFADEEILRGSVLPEIGSAVSLDRRVRTFNGFIPVGDVVVSAAGHDSYGDVIVDLSRNGVLLASGVAWPL